MNYITPWIVGSLLMLGNLEGITTTHFELISYDQDPSIGTLVVEHAEQCYAKISADFDHSLDKVIQINLYPDLKSFHDAINWSDAPDWVVARCDSKEPIISMVSPLNPGPRHTYEGLFKSVAHQITNAYINTFYENVPQWLRVGIAMNEADQSNLVGEYHVEAIKLNPPTLADLDKASPVEFSKMHGYAASYLIVHFMIEEYGFSKIRNILETGSFEESLGMTKDELYHSWTDSLSSLQRAG